MFPVYHLLINWIGRSILYNITNVILFYVIMELNLFCSVGANPFNIIEQIQQKLRLTAAAVQVPIGLEDNLKGVVDLVKWKAVYNEGNRG